MLGYKHNDKGGFTMTTPKELMDSSEKIGDLTARNKIAEALIHLPFERLDKLAVLRVVLGDTDTYEEAN
jgi:hypothetical protein